MQKINQTTPKTVTYLLLIGCTFWSIFMNNFDYTSFQTVSDQVKMSGQAGPHRCSMLQELDEEAWLLIWASSHLSKRSVSNTLEFWWETSNKSNYLRVATSVWDFASKPCKALQSFLKSNMETRANMLSQLVLLLSGPLQTKLWCKFSVQSLLEFIVNKSFNILGCNIALLR